MLLKKKFQVLLVVICLIAAGGAFADADDSIGLSIFGGMKAKNLTNSYALGVDLGLAYQFELWGYDMGVGIDSFEWYFTPGHELNLGVNYWYGKYIGDSAFSYYSAGNYFLRFLGGFNYDADYVFGVAYDLDGIRLVSFDVVWTYYDKVGLNNDYYYFSWEGLKKWLADTKLDTVIGAGYEFSLGKAGLVGLWLDTTFRFFDGQWGFDFYSITPSASYTYYITENLPIMLDIDYKLLPSANWADDLRVSLSAGFLF